MARKMKDSGVKWIGKIPEDWKLRKLKYILCERNVKNDPIKTSEILSLTASQGVIPYAEKEGGGNRPKEDLTAYKLAYPDDIVMNSMNVLSGSVGLSKYHGCVSPVYYMLYSDDENIDIRFYNYVFKTKAFQRSLMGLGNGILIKESENGSLNTIRMRIPMEKLNGLLFFVPDITEQRKIVEFLDEKIPEIDTIISKTKESIEEYKKLRQTVITEVVMKGLNKTTGYKESKLQWVDMIPSHWEKKKILHIISMPVIDGPHVSPELVNEGVPYISADAIEDGKINFDRKRGYITKEYSEECNKRYKPEKNDILVVKLGASTGKMGMVGDDTNFNIWVPLAVVRCKTNVNPHFVFYAMQSIYFKNQIRNGWTFGTQETLGVKTLEQLFVFIPPEEEQVVIVDYLDKKIGEIDALIAKKEEFIKEMEDYKQSLIYEYVTGKKEVV